MEILLHTIAVEPARWTPARVSQSLVALVPRLAALPFRTLEIYEPHLRDRSAWLDVRQSLSDHGLEARILSSYLDLAALSAEELPAATARLQETVAYFGFRQVRIFPGPRLAPDDAEGRNRFCERLNALAEHLPATEFLLETHDGSLADDPAGIVDLVHRLENPRIGLLFQPTVFNGRDELEQFTLQREVIRHVHLQNRKPGGFEKLQLGVTPWEKILPHLGPGVDASVEFVPSGICSVEEFDLETVLAELETERASALKLSGAAG